MCCVVCCVVRGGWRPRRRFVDGECRTTVRSHVPANRAGRVPARCRHARSRRRAARDRLPPNRERDGRPARNRTLEVGDRTRGDAASLSRSRQRSSRVLRRPRRRRRKSRGDRPGEGRRSQGHRSRVDDCEERRSGPERPKRERLQRRQPDRESAAGAHGSKGATAVARRPRGDYEQLLRRDHDTRWPDYSAP